MSNKICLSQKFGWLAVMAAVLSFLVINPLNLYADNQNSGGAAPLDGTADAPPFRHQQSAFHRWLEKNPDKKEQYDADKNGTLDKSERQAARQKWMEEHPEIKEMKKKYDLNHDGKLDKDEREAAQKHWLDMHPDLKKFDKDGNGVLDMKESEAAREEWLKTKPEMKKHWGPGAGPDKQ